MLSTYGCLRVVTTTPFPLLLSVLSRVTPQFINLWVSSSGYGCSRVSFFTINFRVGGQKKYAIYRLLRLKSLLAYRYIWKTSCSESCSLHSRWLYQRVLCYLFNLYKFKRGATFLPLSGMSIYPNIIWRGSYKRSRIITAFKPISFNC